MSIRLTESAATRIASFLAQKPEAVGFRFGVRRTGCSGWAYTVDVADTQGADDQVFVDRGVRVLVDARSLPLIDGTEIDFARRGLNAEFVFRNPNVTGECGCGESFAIS
jgi:iron-sulfur cluster assembly protein